MAIFLTLAPLLPVAGVALSYGPAADPAYELTLAAPYSVLRLVLLRSVAVVTCTVALTAIGALALADNGWQAVAWLLPALALSAATLALSVRTTPDLGVGSCRHCLALHRPGQPGQLAGRAGLRPARAGGGAAAARRRGPGAAALPLQVQLRHEEVVDDRRPGPGRHQALRPHPRPAGGDLHRGRRGHRAARPERRRQDDAAADARHRAGAGLRQPAAARAATRRTPTTGWRSGAGSATCRRSRASTAASPRSTSSTTSRSSRS